jgi:hypothetical protein
MADTGLNASVKINGTTYTSSDCIQSNAINDAINKVVYQCGGYDRAAVGTRVVTFTFSLALAKTDVTKLNDLAPGTVITSFEAHPGGDTDSYIEIVSTSGIIESRPGTWSPNGMIAIDVTCHLNNITFQAASS